MWEQHVENHSYLHGERRGCMRNNLLFTLAMTCTQGKYIQLCMFTACLTHRSRQKWWPRNVVVTSSMYKGCSISSLLSNNGSTLLELYIVFCSKHMHTHKYDNSQVSKSTKWVVPYWTNSKRNGMLPLAVLVQSGCSEIHFQWAVYHMGGDTHQTFSMYSVLL